MQETLSAELRRDDARLAIPRRVYVRGIEDVSWGDRNHEGGESWCCSVILRLRICSFQAMEDDTIPLAHPVRDASERFVDRIFVAKGTSLRIPLVGVNRSEALWGADAGTFNPARWLVYNESESSSGRKEDVQGYGHLLTFAHGPKTCLGKNFAILELKVCLSSLLYVVSVVGVPLTRTCKRSFRSLSGTFRSASEQQGPGSKCVS